jgi:hypothetical protein
MACCGSKVKDRQTAWHKAAYFGYKEIVERLWVWAREMKINVRGDLLLRKNICIQIALAHSLVTKTF